MKKTVEDVARELVADGIGNPNRDKSTGRYSSGGGGMAAAPIGGEPTNFASKGGVAAVQSDVDKFVQTAPSSAGVKVLSVRNSISMTTPDVVEVEFSKYQHAAGFQAYMSSKGVSAKVGHTMGGKGGTVYVRPTSKPSGHRISNTPLFNSRNATPQSVAANVARYK
jgi:hypothetical protein